MQNKPMQVHASYFSPLRIIGIVLLVVVAIVAGFVLPFLIPNNKHNISYAQVGTVCNAGGYPGVCHTRPEYGCPTYFDSGWYCPGPDNIQCCVNTAVACNTPWGSGTCHNTYMSCNGTFHAGYCPGPTDVQCCVPAPAPTATNTPPPADTTPPTVPVLTATVVSPTEIDLSWNASTDDGQVAGYKIIQNGTLLANTTATSFKDQGLTPHTNYTLTVSAYDAAGNNSANSNAVSLQTASLNTTLSLTLLLHGIGKGGDNRNPNGGGTANPVHQVRSITVQVYDPANNSLVLSKDGQVTYNQSAGNFTGDISMGTTLATKTYTLKVITQSLRGTVVWDMIAGQTNTIPVITLVNGDANGDGKLDILDYNLIQGCVSDFGVPPSDCDATRAQEADIDDDGKVDIFDLNLFIRELSVQQL